MSRKSQERYRKAGLCIFCGLVAPRENRHTCKVCGEKKTAYTTALRNRRIQNGKCCVCDNAGLVTKRHCEGCRNKHYERARKGYRLLRDKVFNAYGGYTCACCGEMEQAFLTIDHIHGNGAKHRKTIGQSNFYRWLKKNNFPSGFQVLCMNCQWGKKNCGICPHQRAKGVTSSYKPEITRVPKCPN